jgi:hypothetical protein
MAQPFDLRTRQLKGDAFPLAENVSYEASRYAGFSVSTTGTLVYGRGSSELLQLTWFDRTGKIVGKLTSRRPISASPCRRTNVRSR